MHPSRSARLLPPPEPQLQPRPRSLTKAEQLAMVEEKRKEAERNIIERERKIKARDKKRRDLRKMTAKGQPVMKTRLEDLLSKAKKAMKGQQA